MNDLDLIVQKFPADMDVMHIFPLGDVHVGADEFDETKWKRWKYMVGEYENSQIVLIGDLVDNGLKNSKTDTYRQTMSPFQQKIWLTNELRPFAEQIIGGVRGNHENRSVVLSDGCPMYDIMAKLDKEHLFRENMAFLKVQLGSRTVDRQSSYTIVLAHGKSKSKMDKFAYAIDGMDIFITGHLHSPYSTFPAKISIDVRNEAVVEKPFNHVSIPSFTKIGGYALRDMYLPQSGKIPVIKLFGGKKEVHILWI